MTMGSFRSHFETQHGVYTLVALPADAAQTVMSRQLAAVFDVEEGKYRCPMLDFPQGGEGWGCKIPFNLRWHPGSRHPADKVVVGSECFPRCQLCGM